MPYDAFRETQMMRQDPNRFENARKRFEDSQGVKVHMLIRKDGDSVILWFATRKSGKMAYWLTRKKLEVAFQDWQNGKRALYLSDKKELSNALP